VLMDNAKVKNKAVRLQEKQDLNCKMRNWGHNLALRNWKKKDSVKQSSNKSEV
jgi:hypothetical protein